MVRSNRLEYISCRHAQQVFFAQFVKHSLFSIRACFSYVFRRHHRARNAMESGVRQVGKRVHARLETSDESIHPTAGPQRPGTVLLQLTLALNITVYMVLLLGRGGGGGAVQRS